MAQLLDRNRLYALIGALEDDLRDLIRTHLLDDANETEVLGQAYENAVERLGGDQDALLAGADILQTLARFGDTVEAFARSWLSRLASDHGRYDPEPERHVQDVLYWTR